MIAQLNDVAYKAIKSGSLQKMMDKRALQNKGLYEKLDQEIKNLVANLNIEKLGKEQAEIISDVGDCCFSVANTLEALEEGDCMCLGVKIKRPEAAIADSSRIVVVDVFPTYITA